MSKKNSTYPWPAPLAPPFKTKFKTKFNEDYVEFDFRMGTVLVIFSFFLTDNALCPPHAAPLALPNVKILISILEKKMKIMWNFIL